MKKLFVAVLALFIGTNVAYSQANEVEMFQSMFKVEKKAMLMDFLQLTEEEAKLFWPIYEEFEIERTKNSAARIALIQKYANEYETLTDEQADKLLKESFKIRMGVSKLHRKYYKKFKKAVGAKRGVQFVQFERFVNTSIDNQLNSSLPLVGERM